MKKVEYVLRQGDVYIFRIDEFPEGDKKQDELTKNGQVALGELSGHHHHFDDSAAVDLFKLDAFDGLTFIDIKKNTKLIHGLIKGYKGKESDQDYHNEINLKEGKYITGIVEETDWLTRSIRRVVD
jgi:hypothetical protein